MKNSVSPAMSKSERDYQSEDDHRTMLRAAEITADRGRMKGVARHQRKQQKALSLMQRTMMRGGRR